MDYFQDEYRQRLIGPTLRRAARHPFYRSHWGSLSSSLESIPIGTAPGEYLEFLKSIPSLQQREFVELVHPNVDADDEVTHVSYSSGSTAGPKLRFGTAREFRLLGAGPGDSCLSPSELSIMRPDTEPKPLWLRLLRVWNGNPGVDTSTTLAFSGCLDNDIAVRRAQELLQKHFSLPGYAERISVLAGSVESLKVFTRHLQDVGVPATAFAIEYLSSYGMYLGPDSRRWLMDYWGCEVRDNFSISECPGGGLICTKCGFVNFGNLILPSVAHLAKEHRIDAGVGRLLVTSLLPAGSAQPLINYAPGDLVEWIADGEGCPEHVGGIRRLGRGEYSLVKELDGHAALLVSSQDLHDALDVAGVDRRHPYLRVSTINRNDIYTPRCSMQCVKQADGGYSVQVSYRPEQTGQESKASIMKRRLEGVKRIASLVRSARLTIKVSESADAPAFPWKFA